jgi:hypothetical protein
MIARAVFAAATAAAVVIVARWVVDVVEAHRVCRDHAVRLRPPAPRLASIHPLPNRERRL